MKGFNTIKSILTRNHPYHAQWFITRKCNYRCKSCDVWQNQDSRELSKYEILYGLKELKDLGIAEITFSGGNPLLREDIGEILKYASKYFVTTIYDNGSLAYKKVEILKHADYVAISLDTLDEKKQDWLSGVRGSFREKMRSIKELVKNEIPVAISSTISQVTRKDAIEMVETFGKVKIPFNFSVYNYDPESSQFAIGKKDEEFVIKDRKEITELFQELLEMKKNYPIFLPNKSIEIIKNYYEKGRNWECKAFDKFLTIDNLGRVSGCHLQEPFTDIFHLKDFRYSKEAEEIRIKARKCKKCNYTCYISYSLPILNFLDPILIEVKMNPRRVLKSFFHF
jgi:MoaA/NifB/PqqE/SkfB family radical SAM enzyme